MSAFDFLDDVVRDKPKTRPMPKNLRAAVAVVARVDKFFSRFLDGLTIKHRDDVWCMATNCVDTIYVNYDTLEAKPTLWTPALLACVLTHEMMHIVRDDGPAMAAAKQPDLLNIAADACINRDTVATGWKWPGVRWHDPQKDTASVRPTAEQIAAGLPPTLWRSGHQLATTKRIYEYLVRQKKDKRPQPQDGAGMGGDVDVGEYRKAAKKHGGQKAAREFIRELAERAATQADADAMAEQQPDADQQAAGDGDQQGTGSGDGDGGHGWSLEKSAAARELQALGVRVRSPLTRRLRVAGARVRGLMRSRTHRHSSLLSPSPLSADMGRLMPGRRRATVLRPVIAIDGSGSISDAQMQVQRAAAQEWAQQYVGRTGELRACFFSDSVVAEGPMRQFRDGDKVPGLGGGTNFVPVIEWAAKHRATHLIMFTDACGPWPQMLPRGVRLILVLPEAYMSYPCPLPADRVALDVPQ